MAKDPEHIRKQKSVAIMVVPVESIQQRIMMFRGHKVLLDADLAELYDVSTGRLVEAVKRNLDRFPDDFMFQLDDEEFAALISQIAISNDKDLASGSNQTSGRGGRRTPPYAFTEQGVAMLASVLRSKRAVSVNIAIVRAFVELRRMLVNREAIRLHLAALQNAVDSLAQKVGSHEAQLADVYVAINSLMEPPEAPPKRRLGFSAPD